MSGVDRIGAPPAEEEDRQHARARMTDGDDDTYASDLDTIIQTA